MKRKKNRYEGYSGKSIGKTKHRKKQWFDEERQEIIQKQKICLQNTRGNYKEFRIKRDIEKMVRTKIRKQKNAKSKRKSLCRNQIGKNHQ